MSRSNSPKKYALYEDSPMQHRMHHAYSSDFDLMLPFTRKQATEDLWMQKRPLSAVPRDPPKPLIESSELKELAQKQHQMLLYYQTKYPQENLSDYLGNHRSQDASKFKELLNWKHLSPIWKAYDEQLIDVESKNKALQSENLELKEKKAQLLEDIANLKDSGNVSSVATAKIKLLQEEVDMLVNQNRRNEAIIQKAFQLQQQQESLDATVKSLQEEVESLQRLNERVISDKAVLENQLQSTQLNYQKLIAEHETTIRMLKSAKLQEHEAMNALTRIEKESQRIIKDQQETHSWVMKNALPCLKDYERGLKILGVELSSEALNPPISASALTVSEITGVSHISTRLEDKIKYLLKDMKESLQKNEIQQQEFIQQNNNYSELLHKYEQESDDHRHQMNTSKAYIERLILMTEKCRSDRDHALEQSKRVESELYKLRHDHELYVRQSNEQLEQVMEQTRSKIRHLEQNYENYREQLEEQIGSLQNSKVDLQVGMLLRDKRNVEEELRQVHKEWDQARDIFYSEVKTSKDLEKKLVERALAG